MQMDKARKKTDKQLLAMEKDISRVYRTHPALIEIEKKYQKFMSMVEKRTEGSYRAYINETDKETKDELKKVYMDEIKALTVNSKEYKKLIDEITTVLARVNQDALDIVNAGMLTIYAENYNQVAEKCRKAGIKVNE